MKSGSLRVCLYAREGMAEHKLRKDAKRASRLYEGIVMTA